MSEEQYKFTKQDCIGCREYMELQQENEELKNINEKLSLALDSAEDKNHKTVEYIEKEIKEINKHQYATGTRRLSKILQILKGTDNEDTR
jgi:hypothetical protein